MHYRVLASLVFGLSLWVSAAYGEEQASHLESLFQQLVQYNLELISAPDGFDVQGLMAKYEELGFGRYVDGLSELSDTDLTWLYRSMSSILLYDPRSDLASDQSAVFDELDSRNALEAPHIRSHYRQLIRAEQLEQAQVFAREYEPVLDDPLTPIPEVIDGGHDPGKGPSVLRVVGPDQPLVRENLELHNDLTILVQFHPNCGMASVLMERVAEEETWKRFIAERAYLLAANPTDILGRRALHEWNETSPFEVYLLEKRSDWPMIDRFSTPSFYILQDDQDVESFGGYTSETLERLREIMIEVGIAYEPH